MKKRIRETAGFILWLALFAVICRMFVYGMERQGYQYIAPAAQQDTREPIAREQEEKQETEQEKKDKAKQEKKRKKKKAALKKARQVSFRESLEKFPASYQEALKALHKQHPKWHFEAVNTAVSWDQALTGESQAGRNSIEIDPHSHLSYVSMEQGAYHEADDSFIEVDAGGRYTPSGAVIAYYMDPRNFLTESGVFQFEDLSYNQYHKQKVVQSILNHTFMEGSYTCTLSDKNGKKKTMTRKYAGTFMIAGRKAGVNPYHLASRVIQEVGSQGSASVSGKSGYYNFFNIGAGDSPGGGAVSRGLSYAAGSGSYDRPWNDPYRAILGGAQFLGEEYITEGQDTLYFQKWSVASGDKLFWHQYMSNVQAPVSEAAVIYQAYKDAACLEEEFVFRIPVYGNMPSAVSRLPGEKANPNHYLRSLRVVADGEILSLSPEFTYDTTSYQIRVPQEVSGVRIAARPASAYASVRGTGSRALSAGRNVISVTCTAQDGTRLTYHITIIRSVEKEEPPESGDPAEDADQASPEQEAESGVREDTEAATRDPGETEGNTEADVTEKTEASIINQEGDNKNDRDGEYAKQSNSVCNQSAYGGETQGERSSVYRASNGGGSDRIQNYQSGGADGGSPAP